MPYVWETTEDADVMEVKFGDTRRIRWQLPGVDLTGATAKIFIEKDGVPQELAADVDTPATEGYVSHKLTGTLAIGEYLLEIQISRESEGGPPVEDTTSPSGGYSRLRVVRSLG